MKQDEKHCSHDLCKSKPFRELVPIIAMIFASNFVCEPLATNKIGCKYLSNDNEFAGTYSFLNPPTFRRATPMSYVACTYHFSWWIGMVTEVYNDEKTLFCYNQAFSQRKNNPRELWKLIKSVIPSQKRPIQPTKLLTDNGIIEDPTKISEDFNHYFSEVGANIAKNASVNINNDTTFKKYLKNSVINTIILDSPQTTEVYNIINSLIPHKAQGHDNISSHFLRLGSEVLAPILAQLFSHVFE